MQSRLFGAQQSLFGSQVLHRAAEQGWLDANANMAMLRSLHLPDYFQAHGKPDAMYRDVGMDAEQIVARALEAVGVDAMDDLPTHQSV